jgi:hypothetical protein
MKPLGHLVPDVEVHPEGDVALVEGVFEFGDLRALGGGGEDDEIEIGIRAGGAFDAGAVGPDGDAGKVATGAGSRSFSPASLRMGLGLFGTSGRPSASMRWRLRSFQRVS